MAAYNAAWRANDALPPRPWYWTDKDPLLPTQKHSTTDKDDNENNDEIDFESSDYVLATDYRLLQVFTGKFMFFYKSREKTIVNFSFLKNNLFYSPIIDPAASLSTALDPRGLSRVLDHAVVWPLCGVLCALGASPPNKARELAASRATELEANG